MISKVAFRHWQGPSLDTNLTVSYSIEYYNDGINDWCPSASSVGVSKFVDVAKIFWDVTGAQDILLTELAYRMIGSDGLVVYQLEKGADYPCTGLGIRGLHKEEIRAF